MYKGPVWCTHEAAEQAEKFSFYVIQSEDNLRLKAQQLLRELTLSA